MESTQYYKNKSTIFFPALKDDGKFADAENVGEVQVYVVDNKFCQRFWSVLPTQICSFGGYACRVNNILFNHQLQVRVYFPRRSRGE